MIVPLEYSFGGKKFFFFRREWINDTIFYFGQALVWNATTIFVLSSFFELLDLEFLQSLQKEFILLPFWLQFLFVILCSDIFIYWGHRFQHKYEILWRFHRVHHTAETVDFLAAFREHPLDNIYTRGLETLPAILLGFPTNDIFWFITFRGLWALFIHSNVQLRLGFLEYIFGSPHLHHWHHELEKKGLCNYANLSPLMDLAFGTFYSPKETPPSYGVSDNYFPSYIELLVEPFLFSRWKKILLEKKRKE